MGGAYAASGPWLEADPFLFTAAGPPAPAAWLSDLALHALERVAGLRGLRAANALAVAAILALAWSALRKESGSRVFASLGCAVFAALSAYRLFQLRPHLVTLLAVLLLLRSGIATGEPASRRRLAALAAGFALWANAHGGFVLGLVLLAAALAGLALAARLQPEARALHAARARRLAGALGLAGLATLANPAGARQHLLFWSAGGRTPALGLVADEWAPVSLLAWPAPNTLPSPLAWTLVWALLLLTPCALWLLARTRRRAASAPLAERADPALYAMGAVSLLGMLSAVRLLWLGILPLLALGHALRARDLRRAAAPPLFARPALRWGAAAVALLLVPAFAWRGDWWILSQGLRPARYGEPYLPAKYYAHAVWFLQDAGLEGHLWNDYGSGNFLGYWLAPRLRVFVNGSLNVPAEVMEAEFAIRGRRGLEPDERFVDRLDREDVDLFFGTGLPAVPRPGRPKIATTTHLERTPGWIPVFRSIQSAVYLRGDARNRPNLERVADYYARAGVPFDPERGFDPERVIREAPAWAVAHGLIPAQLPRIEAAARSLDPRLRRAARERLASIYALIGAYERAAALDRQLLGENPGSVSAARRLVWSLLHAGRGPESVEAAERLARIAAPQDALSALLASEARRCASLPAEERRTRIARLPAFGWSELRSVLAGFREPEARIRRPTEMREFP